MDNPLLHKSGVIFLILAFFSFLAYFVTGAGSVSLSQKSADANKWRGFLSVFWKVCVGLAVLSFANLLPRFVEEPAARLIDSALAALGPIARKVPFLGGFI
jgi:hypothetical protein